MGVERGTRATRKDAFCGCLALLVLLAFVALAFARLACSRRSDSGERCEVKRSASPPLLFIAFFTSSRSPLSERLEQAIARPGKRRKITPVLQARLENIFWQIRSSCKVMQLELVLKGLEASPHPVLEPAVPLNDRHCLHPQCGETQQGLLLNKLVR